LLRLRQLVPIAAKREAADQVHIGARLEHRHQPVDAGVLVNAVGVERGPEVVGQAFHDLLGAGLGGGRVGRRGQRSEDETAGDNGQHPAAAEPRVRASHDLLSRRCHRPDRRPIVGAGRGFAAG
jgi:hypothetical protein